MHALLTTPHTATTAVAGRRIVKHGAADGTAIQATAATEAFLGVSAPMGASAGAILDVVQVGWAQVEYGGNVTRGDPLTADANACAVKANPAAGATAQVVGYATVSGVAGDFGGVTLSRGQLTTPAE